MKRVDNYANEFVEFHKGTFSERKAASEAFVAGFKLGRKMASNLCHQLGDGNMSLLISVLGEAECETENKELKK